MDAESLQLIIDRMSVQCARPTKSCDLNKYNATRPEETKTRHAQPSTTYTDFRCTLNCGKPVGWDSARWLTETNQRDNGRINRDASNSRALHMSRSNEIWFITSSVGILNWPKKRLHWNFGRMGSIFIGRATDMQSDPCKTWQLSELSQFSNEYFRCNCAFATAQIN